MKDKTVLVTGGGRDIGRSICLKFAIEGYNVALNYFHSEEQALETLEEVQSKGVSAIAVQADLSTQQE